jgi:aminoglycoside phosphotransferase (APT) family kinase protein
VANRIYATDEIVLRIATDHPDAVVDARTESVAAPAAFAVGVLTPRLLVFDDSRAVIDRPYSIWERIHAETLGLAQLGEDQRNAVWLQVGTELARLHSEVASCPDPNGYLENTERDLDLDALLETLIESGNADAANTGAVRRLLHDLRPHMTGNHAQCFVHNDLHEMNVMCSRQGDLRAILDWGDAGWGDPTLDFAVVPLNRLSATLAGYGESNVKRLGEKPEVRFIWDRLHNAIENAIESATNRIPVEEYRRFLDSVA